MVAYDESISNTLYFSIATAKERDNGREKNKKRKNDKGTGRIANHDCWHSSGREAIENCTNRVQSEQLSSNRIAVLSKPRMLIKLV